MIIKKNEKAAKAQMLIKIDNDLSERIRAAAKRELRSVNSFVAFAVRSYIENTDRKKD